MTQEDAGSAPMRGSHGKDHTAQTRNMVEPQVIPRLWGEWGQQFFQSGTTIVALRSAVRKPHLYVHADSSSDEDRYQRDRYVMCYELAAYMNGVGKRPAWLDDMKRVSEATAVSLTGASVRATGPFIDIDPPRLNWREDDSDEAKNDRARLMDALFIG
jgi:hypothetical protein